MSEVYHTCLPLLQVSAACFTHDCRHVMVGDKFGDVYSLLVDPDTKQKELKPLLGHYCAIITSMLSTDLGCATTTSGLLSCGTICQPCS